MVPVVPEEIAMNALKTALIEVVGRTLPRRAKNAFFHASFHLARPEYERFAHAYSYAPNMELGLAAMAGRGFSPRTIVDVGAFLGDWSTMARRIWPASNVVMIEPNREQQEGLEKVATELGARLFGELLGAENGRPVQFQVMGSGSSIMPERSALPRRAETRRLRTLDSLLKQIEPPGLLKIDAQGYELEILKGATAALRKFAAVLLEIAFIEINDGAPLLHDVIAFMKAHGFVAYDILEIHRRPLDQALNQVDIIFVTEASPLRTDKRHFA
jgi:FkbM family methyltransferase